MADRRDLPKIKLVIFFRETGSEIEMNFAHIPLDFIKKRLRRDMDPDVTDERG